MPCDVTAQGRLTLVLAFETCMRLAYDDAFDGACAEAAKEREQRQRKASTQRPDDAQPTVSDILSKLSTPPAVEPNAATQRSPTPPGNL